LRASFQFLEEDYFRFPGKCKASLGLRVQGSGIRVQGLVPGFPDRVGERERERERGERERV
jgi:hypothetical protein